MAVATNEPYQRVSRDNGIFDGALIGAAVGAGGAGAHVFGSRMSYNGIDNRVKRQVQGLQNKLDHQISQVDNSKKKYDRAVDKAGPRFYESAHQELIEKIKRSPDIQTRNSINQNVQGRVDKKFNKYEKAVERVADTSSELIKVSTPEHLQGLKDNHRYSRHMGGWKSAAIIGASAVIGGGIGMISDGLNR